MSVLNRRLAKVEAVLNPPPPPQPIVLTQPATEAADEQRQAFARALVEAKASGNRVIVIADVISRYVANGVEYMSGLDAVLEVRASKPSECGNRNLLEDDIFSIMPSRLEVRSETACAALVRRTEIFAK